MKTKLHEQQLFHWIGRDIETKHPGKSMADREHRAECYVNHLKNSLNHGIWVKTPETGERFGVEVIDAKLNVPMACFTEWRPIDSGTHTMKYGRLGFGFPRNWVSKNGGQPVTYVNRGAKSPYVKALKAILQAASGSKLKDDKQLQYLHPHLQYVLNYVKPVRELDSHISPSQKTTAPTPRRTMATFRERDPYRRSFGVAMPLVAEREWRIVALEAPWPRPRYLKPAEPGHPAKFFLKYAPGLDLFTLVVPDNLTMRRVLASNEIMKELHHDKRPHVTLLSLEDVGSF